MPAALAAAALCVALASVPLHAEPVAFVMGEAIDHAEVVAAGTDPADALYARLWPPLVRHYLEEQGLAAAADEVSEVTAYYREFERRDRAQRARKLAELESRIAAGPAEAERAGLESFRDVLRRLARRDAEREAKPPDPAGVLAWARAEVEAWKVQRALFRQFGGVVGQTRSGPDPQGARLALIAEGERRGLLRFENAALRARLLDWLARPPAIVVPPARVDFTPYWRQPIPPSYFPDHGDETNDGSG